MPTNWAQLNHTKREIDEAGRGLAGNSLTEADREQALEILGNWRSTHSFPLNTLQVGLRRYSSQITPQYVVAQRLKRVTSIVAKLRRFQGMRLSRMQDLGGCRSVVYSSRQVEQLVKIYKRSAIRHELVGEKDYISEPKDSGYRGVHLIYKYISDRTPTYNGLRIEIQLRSRYQHAWATAVETVGTFLQQSLKSSEGPEQWLEFFTLASAAFARLEKTAAVPGTPTRKRELLRDLRGMAKDLDVRTKLENYRSALQELESRARRSDKYFLLSLEPERLTVESFRTDQLAEATDRYLEVESFSAAADTVLVAADSVDSLRRAYPNYFLDTQVFLRTLDRALSE